MPFKNKQQAIEYQQAYYRKYHKIIKDRSNQHYQNNKEHHNKVAKQNYLNNIDDRRQYAKDRYVKNRELWWNIIVELNMNYCWQSGIEFTSFYQIDFHHLIKKDKEYRISNIFHSKPNDKGIKELKKCVPLFAAIHRKYHRGDIILNLPFTPANITLPNYTTKIIPVLNTRNKWEMNNRMKWQEMLIKLNMNYSWYSGKALNDFDNLEFHHIKDTEGNLLFPKKYAISTIFNSPITKERINELKKCIPLTIEEHRLEQAGLLIIDNNIKLFPLK